MTPRAFARILDAINQFLACMLKKFFATAALALLMLSPVSVFAQTETVLDEPPIAAETTTFQQEPVSIEDFAQLTEENGFEQKTVLATIMAAMGAIFIIMIIPMLAIFVYMMVALIKIAQKTNTPNGWLVIIPFVLPFKLAKFAGLSYWYGLISLAYFPALFIHKTFAVVVALIILAFSTYLWMRVCERLAFSKWLGLLMIVPIANLVLPGVLAFSKNQAVDLA